MNLATKVAKFRIAGERFNKAVFEVEFQRRIRDATGIDFEVYCEEGRASDFWHSSECFGSVFWLDRFGWQGFSRAEPWLVICSKDWELGNKHPMLGRQLLPNP